MQRYVVLTVFESRKLVYPFEQFGLESMLHNWTTETNIAQNTTKFIHVVELILQPHALHADEMATTI